MVFTENIMLINKSLWLSWKVVIQLLGEVVNNYIFNKNRVQTTHQINDFT